MHNYLIFQGEDNEIEYPCTLRATNEKKAIDEYLNYFTIPDAFIEHIHEWASNAGIAEYFFYDENSEGQKNVSKKQAEKKVYEYFQEKPEYGKIFLDHWFADLKDEESGEYMKRFPDNMIRFIWIKQMKREKYGYWTKLNILNLDLVPVLK